MLYECIRKAMKSRAIDLVRKYGKTKQWAFENDADSYEVKFRYNEYPDVNTIIEKDVTDRLFICQMINDPVLTESERNVLNTMLLNPDMTYRELANQTGYDHPEQIRRILKRVASKLENYKDDFYSTMKQYPAYYSKPVKRENAE